MAVAGNGRGGVGRCLRCHCFMKSSSSSSRRRPLFPVKSERFYNIAVLL